jgi:hypothetical protein
MRNEDITLSGSVKTLTKTVAGLGSAGLGYATGATKNVASVVDRMERGNFVADIICDSRDLTLKEGFVRAEEKGFSHVDIGKNFFADLFSSTERAVGTSKEEEEVKPSSKWKNTK